MAGKDTTVRSGKTGAAELARLKKELALSEKQTLKTRLESSRLQQRLALTTLELDLHKEICEITRTGFQLERVLDRIMNQVLKVTATEAGTLFLLSEDKEQLIFQTVKGPKAKT